jgi:polygalacturonase
MSTSLQPQYRRYQNHKWRIAIAVCSVVIGISIVLALVILRSRSVNSSASNFSDRSCSASGATSTRVFAPSGAVANTTTDSTDAIQRAINAAASAGGGVVALPAGTFLIDGHLILKNNVKLTGVGPQTVLKAGPKFLDSKGPEGGYPVVTTSGASNVTIANLTADQNGTVLNGNADPRGRLVAFLIDVRNSHNAVVDGVYTRNPFTYSIAVVGSSEFCVTHCNTRVATSGRYNSLDGIHILDSHTGQVIDNYVDQRVGTDGDDGLTAHTLGAPVYDVLYANNRVRGGNNGDGMMLAVSNYPIYDVTIRDNYFWGSPFGIRTGYFDSGANGAVHNITITGNSIYNLIPGNAFPYGGNAIDIGGFGARAPVTDIMVTKNLTCHAGIITVVRGAGNTVGRNHSCP